MPLGEDASRDAAQAAALLHVLHLPRNADRRIQRQQHEEAAGEAHLRRHAHALARVRFAGHLHDHVLPLLQGDRHLARTLRLEGRQLRVDRGALHLVAPLLAAPLCPCSASAGAPLRGRCLGRHVGVAGRGSLLRGLRPGGTSLRGRGIGCRCIGGRSAHCRSPDGRCIGGGHRRGEEREIVGGEGLAPWTTLCTRSLRLGLAGRRHSTLGIIRITGSGDGPPALAGSMLLTRALRRVFARATTVDGQVATAIVAALIAGALIAGARFGTVVTAIAGALASTLCGIALCAVTLCAVTLCAVTPCVGIAGALAALLRRFLHIALDSALCLVAAPAAIAPATAPTTSAPLPISAAGFALGGVLLVCVAGLVIIAIFAVGRHCIVRVFMTGTVGTFAAVRVTLVAFTPVAVAPVAVARIAAASTPFTISAAAVTAITHIACAAIGRPVIGASIRGSLIGVLSVGALSVRRALLAIAAIASASATTASFPLATALGILLALPGHRHVGAVLIGRITCGVTMHRAVARFAHVASLTGIAPAPAVTARVATAIAPCVSASGFRWSGGVGGCVVGGRIFGGFAALAARGALASIASIGLGGAFLRRLRGGRLASLCRGGSGGRLIVVVLVVLIIPLVEQVLELIEGRADVREVEEGVLLLADVDERGVHPLHDAFNAPQVDGTYMALLVGDFEENFGEAVVFSDCNAQLRGGRVDDDLFLHEQIEGSVDLSGGHDYLEEENAAGRASV